MRKKRNKQLTFIIYSIFIFIISACSNRSDSIVLIKANDNDIKLEIDSVSNRPEMAFFPVQIKITNYSNKKAILIFDTIFDAAHEWQTKNLYLTVPKDTFALGFNGTYLVLNERSVTSYIICEGYFGIEGKGVFKNFDEISSAFSRGKIEYNFNGQIPHYIDQEKLKAIADTFLIPYKLVASTDKAKIVSKFVQYDSIFRIKTEKLP